MNARRLALGLMLLLVSMLWGAGRSAADDAPKSAAEKAPEPPKTAAAVRDGRIASGWDAPAPGPSPVDYGAAPAPLSAEGYGPGPVEYSGPPVGAVGSGPPPGTVGRTYRMPTRKVPHDKHPRTAMLAVFDSEADDMHIEGMKGYKDPDGVWYFESKEPLIPGIPHIYHVKAKMGGDEDAPIAWRTVRLIPGKILDLDW